MSANSRVSRRSILRAIATSPVLTAAALPTEASTADAHLIAAGRRFEQLTVRFDQIISGDSDFDDNFFAEFDRIESEILASHATTIEGLRVKARAASWALLGDLDSVDDAPLDKSMALSIVRDLIRLHDPSLEHPGALRKLVEDATNCTSKSTPPQRDDII